MGSEGTLAYFKRLRLKLSPIPKHKVLGVCHFPTFYQAMDLTQHIVKLDPDAVELVDRTMIDLARGNAAFRPIVDRFLQGRARRDPAGGVRGRGQHADRCASSSELVELMADLGLPGSVVEITDAALQRDIWEVRKAGLNIMMSMKGDGKPVSFIEDCAVPLEHLAEYTDRLTQVFEKHGTQGHLVRARLGRHAARAAGAQHEDRRRAEDARDRRGSLRAGQAVQGRLSPASMATGWCAPSGSSRSWASGSRARWREIKDLFDPKGLMNPGKIVRPTRMDDRTLFRFKPGYAALEARHRARLERMGRLRPARWRCATTTVTAASSTPAPCVRPSALPATSSTSRAAAPTRCGWRLSGQLGPDALTSQAMYDTLATVRELQGLPARMSDRRGHGAG